jgi:hypothetical protein
MSASPATRLGGLLAAALLASPALVVPAPAAPDDAAAPSLTDCADDEIGQRCGEPEVFPRGSLAAPALVAVPAFAVFPGAPRAWVSVRSPAPHLAITASILRLAPKTSPPRPAHFT